jgi:CHAT domain-containing protein/Tfp pilus assembly protein PilF
LEPEYSRRLVYRYMPGLDSREGRARRIIPTPGACIGRRVFSLALSAITLWSAMLSATVGLAAQSVPRSGQQRTDIAGADPAATMLDLERPITRDLAPSESHAYEINLAINRYFRVIVEPQELDVSLSIVGPDGHPIVKKISPYGPQGPVDASLVVTIEGSYKIAVSATANNAHTGRYQIRVDAIRPATARDVLVSRAIETIAEAQQLRGTATAESRRAAIGRYEQALPLLRSAGDQLGEALALEWLAGLHNDLGDNKKAVELLIHSLHLFRSLHDRRGEAMAQSDLGSVENDLGNNQQALIDLNQALSIRKDIGDQRAAAETLEYIGDVYENTSEPERALQTYNTGLILRRKIGDLRGEAESLDDIGVVYYDIDDEQTALEYYEKALPIHQSLHDLWGEALTLNNFGTAYDSLGDKKKALEYFTKSLPLKVAVGNRRGEAQTLSNMCSAEQTLGEWQNAIDHCRAALKISREIGDRQQEAASLTKLGLVYATLGETNTALRQFQVSLALSRATNWPLWESTNLNNIGRVFYEAKENDKALENYRLALGIRRKVQDLTGEAATLCNMGRSYEAQGDKLAALDHFEQALRVSRTAGSQQWEATSLNDVAWIYGRNHQPEKALATFSQALTTFRNVGDPRGEASVLYGRARVEKDLGELSSAVADIESALKIVETLRAKVTSQQLRMSYFSSVREYYDFYIDLLMELSTLHPSDGYDAKAFVANERSKARSLLESLGEVHAEIHAGVDQQLLERERTLQRLLDGKVERRMRLLAGKHTQEQDAATKTEMERLLGEYEGVEAEIRAKSPGYAALTQAPPLSVGEIQREILDPNTILLEYSLGQQHSYVWAVTPNSFKAYELPEREKIEKLAKRAYGFARTRSQQGIGQHEEKGHQTAYSGALADLSRMVLTPVASLLTGKRLLIVSDGAMQYVPFGILPEPSTSPRRGVRGTQQTPLVVEHEIVNLPSASTLAALRLQEKNRRVAPRAVAVLADPVFDKGDSRVRNPSRAAPTHNKLPGLGGRASEPSLESLANARRTRSAAEAGLTGGFVFPRLVFSRREADSVLAGVPAEERMEALDFEASQSTATSEQLSRYRIVHFATHGLLDSQHPELSSLVLSLVDMDGKPQNGYLQLRNIYNLKLSADLVVLSGCETALGKDVKGEGLLGLTRGFMYAGAPRVVASLWQVDDAATAELMGTFYRAMLTEHLAPAAALRQAQIQTRKQRRWSSPYYWGAFVIQGDWQ